MVTMHVLMDGTPSQAEADRDRQCHPGHAGQSLKRGAYAGVAGLCFSVMAQLSMLRGTLSHVVSPGGAGAR